MFLFLFLQAIYSAEVEVGDFKYSLNVSTQKAAIIKGTCPSAQKALTIPGSVSSGSVTYAVDEIGEGAFEGCTNYIGDLTVPDTIVNIGDNAFTGCTGLSGTLTFNAPVIIRASFFSGVSTIRNLVLGNKVLAVGARAFDSVLINGGTVNFGSGVKKIESMAFAFCKFSGDITIPKCVTEIGKQFMHGVTGVTKITINAALTELTPFSLMNMNNFDTIVIGNDVQALGEECFKGLKHFKSITLGTGIKTFGRECFCNMAFTGTFEVPSYVTYVGIRAFADTTFETLKFMATIKEIDYSCFAGATIKTALTIDNVESIGARSFEGAFTQEIDVTIGSKVSKIGSIAFNNCKIKSLNIAQNIKDISRLAFFGITAGSITLTASSEGSSSEWFVNTNVKDLTVGMKSIGSSTFSDRVNITGKLVLQSSLEEIGANAFANTGLTGSITIPSSIKVLGDGAFANNKFDGSLTINAPVTVEASVFSGCDKWKGDLTIGDGCVGIGARAFDGLFLNGGKLVISSSCKKIGSMAFNGCKFSGELTVPSSVTSLGAGFANAVTGCETLNIQASIDQLVPSALKGISGFKKVKLGDNVKAIGDNVFQGITHLTELSLGNGIQTIGVRSFEGFQINQDLTVPASVVSISTAAFQNSKWVSLNFQASLKEITQDTFVGAVFSGATASITNAEKIGARAFEGCFSTNEVTLTIGTKVTSIGSMAFKDCKIKGTFTIGKTIVSISRGAFYGITATKLQLTPGISKTQAGWFEGPNSIDELEIGGDIVEIGASTFEESTAFKKVLTIPAAVTAIGQKAFFHCSGFTGSLTIPATVKSLGEECFAGATGFNGDLIINADVKEIPETIFSDKPGFKGSLTIGDSIEKISPRAFEGIAFAGTLTIGKKVKAIETAAFHSCPFTGEVIIPASVSTIQKLAFSGTAISSLKIMADGVSIFANAFTTCANLKSVIYCGNNQITNETPIFDAAITKIKVSPICKLDKVGGIPTEFTNCAQCGLTPGPDCPDVTIPTSAPTIAPTSVPTSVPTSKPTSAPTIAPTSAPTSVPTSKPTSAPTSKPTTAPTSKPTTVPTIQPSAEPTSTSVEDIVEVETGASIVVKAADKTNTLVLKGDASIKLESTTTMTIKPHSGNTNKKAKITFSGEIASNVVIVSDFNDVSFSLSSSKTPLVINNIPAVTIISTKSITINELNSRSSKSPIVFSSTSAEVSINQVYFEGENQAITIQGNVKVLNLALSNKATSSLTSAKITNGVSLAHDSHLTAKGCSFETGSIVTFSLASFKSTTRLSLAPESSKVLDTSIGSFEPNQILVSFSDTKAGGEVTIIDGVNQEKGQEIAKKVVITSTDASKYTTVYKDGSIIISAPESESEGGGGLSPVVLYAIIGVAAVAVIVVVVVVIVVVKKRKGGSVSSKKAAKDQFSASENIGSALQSPLLF